MSDFNEFTFPVGMAADVHVNPIGPLESRRLRRERNLAAAGPRTRPDTNPGTDFSEAPLAPVAPVVTDELAIQRQRKPIDHSERTRILTQGLIS